MTREMITLRQEIDALQQPLEVYAARLAGDDDEARDLVRFTLHTALDDRTRLPDGDTKLWLFALMRQAFHSVARRRATLRERGSAGQQWRADRAEVFVQAEKARLT